MPLIPTDSRNSTEPARLAQPPAHHAGAEAVLWSRWRVAQDRYGALRWVVLEQRGGTIYLRGHVPSNYLKQVALETVCALAGPAPIVNQIEVITHVRRAPPSHSHLAPRLRDTHEPADPVSRTERSNH